MPGGRVSLLIKHESGTQLCPSENPHEAGETPVAFHLVFSTVSHFPDELSCRTPVTMTWLKEDEGTPTTQPSLNPLGCSWGLSEDLEGSV